MAILSQTGYTNVGNDLQVYMTGTAMPIVIPNVVTVQWHQLVVDIAKMQLNYLPFYAQIPNGYEGAIDFHRQNGDFEAAMVGLQTNWLNGGDYQFNTLTCIVSNSGANTFVFTKVAIRLEDGGSWAGDDVTRCRLAFKAARIQ